MVYISINAVITVSLVLIGSTPCTSTECTSDNIYYKCNFFAENDCQYFKKNVKCLEDLESNCTDDTLIQELTDRKNRFIKLDAECPDYPPGFCYFNAFAECGDIINWNMYSLKSLSSQDKKKKCNGVEKKAQMEKTCLKKIKVDCVAKHIHDVVESQIERVDEFVEICGQ